MSLDSTAKILKVVKFIADVAKEANVPYVVIGASSLSLRDVTRRITRVGGRFIARSVTPYISQDVDVHIGRSYSPVFQAALHRHLVADRAEKVIVYGDEAVKAEQTKWKFFKSFEGLPSRDNMKVDVQESVLPLMPECFSELHGANIADVAPMIIFKICAIGRPNRSAFLGKLQNDVEDLQLAVNYMINTARTVSPGIQQLFAMENPPLVWANFWAAIGLIDVDEDLEEKFNKINIKKTRD